MSGKGSKPRNLSNKFKDNYDKINWSKKSENKNKVDKIHKPNSIDE